MFGKGLKAYELVPEAYRQKIRNFKKDADKTHVEFAREKERLFDRWFMMKRNGTDFTNLKEMILLEELSNCVHSSIKNHITENKAQTLQKASEMAGFSLTNIFFRRGPRVPLLKETFTMWKIFLVSIIHQI